MNRFRTIFCRVLLTSLLLFVVAACSDSPSSRPVASPTASSPQVLSRETTQALTEKLNSYVPGTVKGLGVLLSRGGSTIYTYAHGNLQLDSVVPLASATKLASATAIMTLVDQGKVALDRPISTYLNGHLTWPAAKAAVTLRMLLAHSSGLAQDRCIGDQKGETLQSCTQKIANDALVFEPGTSFAYEGADYQVAGYIAELVSGKSWSDFFTSVLAAPLDMKSFTYGASRNPRIAGGASSNMADYTKLLQLHLDNGLYHGQRILSQNAVEAMRKDTIGTLPVKKSPGAKNHLNGYGLGWWISDSCLYPGSPGPEYSDQGAFGYTPWIDPGLKYTGVLMLRARLTTGTQIWNGIRPLIIKGLTGKAASAPSCTSE